MAGERTYEQIPAAHNDSFAKFPEEFDKVRPRGLSTPISWVHEKRIDDGRGLVWSTLKGKHTNESKAQIACYNCLLLDERYTF